MKNSLLVFGTKNFNNSLNEIKEYLNFTLIFFKKDTFPHTNILEIKAVIVDSEICNDAETLTLINEIKNKPFLLLEHNLDLKSQIISTFLIIKLPSH